MPKRGLLLGFGLIVILSLLLLISSTPAALAGGESSDEVLEITEIGPITNSRGELTHNPDGTYYPGDYFQIIVEGTPDGRHGRGVPTGEWVRVETRDDTKDYWYGGEKKIVERGKRGFDNQSEYESFVINLGERSDVSEDSISTYPNGYDYVQWRGVYEYEAPSGPGSTFKSDWFDFKADAEGWLDEEKQKYGDTVKNPHLEDRIKKNYRYGVEWSDTDWKIELLELEPIVNVDNAGSWPLTPTVCQYNLEDNPKKRIVYQVDMQTYRDHPERAETNLPGTAYARVTYPAPTEGHNIPDEYADDDIVIKKPVRIVNYEPVLRAIPYKVTNWKRDETDSMMQRPDAIATRYDGDGDVEGENLTLDGRRTVVSGFSAQGVITKPLHASKFTLRFADDGRPYYENEGVDPPRVVADNHYWVDGKLYNQYGLWESDEIRDVPHGSVIRLAKKPDGTYYESGVLVSPVYDVGVPVKWGRRAEAFSFTPLYTPPPEHKHVAGKRKDEPPGTFAYIYVGLSNNSDMADAEWRTVELLPGGYSRYQTWDRVTARYLQFVVVLRTVNPNRTPRVSRIYMRTKIGDNIYSIGCSNWGGDSGVELKRVERAEGEYGFGYFKGVGNDYLTWGTPEFYREGDTILTDEGLPWTGIVELSPIKKDYRFEREVGYASTRVNDGIMFELGKLKLPGEVPEDVIEERYGIKVSSGEEGFPRLLRGSVSWDVPKYTNALLLVPSVKLPEDKWREIDNEVVFAVDSGCWRYDNSNRYKKWRFMFFERRGLEVARWHTENTVPDLGDWFSDAEVSFDVTLWFGQKVNADGAAWRRLRKGGWDYRESWKRIATKTLTWSPMSTRQPVKVTAWELRDWAEQKISENAKVVLLDNAWKPDESVDFKFAFTSVESPKKFLRGAKKSAELMKPLLEGGENENALWENTKLEDLITDVENLERRTGIDIMKEAGVPRKMISSLRTENVAASVKAGLLSISKMDEKMMDMIIEDAFITGEGPQIIEGENGEGSRDIEFRGVNFFTIEENIWMPGKTLENELSLENRSAENQGGWLAREYLGENVQFVEEFMRTLGMRNEEIWLGTDGKVHRYEIASLPFSEENVEFNINLSGEGMAAEVTSDARDRAVITIYAPPRAGGLRHALLLGVEHKNLLSNSSFEEDEASPDNVKDWNLKTANVSRSSDRALSGSWSILQEDLTSLYGGDIKSSPVEVVPRGKYKCSAWAYLENSRIESLEDYDYQLQVEWLNAKKSVVSIDSLDEHPSAVGEWEELGFVRRAPKNARYARVVIRARTSEPDSTNVYWDDATLLEESYDRIEERDYRLEVFGWLPRSQMISSALGWSEEGRGGADQLTFWKWGDSPEDLVIVMTNEWGASTSQLLRVSPGRLWSIEGGGSWWWFAVGVILMITWIALVNWLKDRRRAQAVRGQFP